MALMNYQGQILVAQPRCDSPFFKESCILIARHTDKGSWGMVINKHVKTMNCDLQAILNHIGIENTRGINAPIYVGGPIHTNQVCILHSSDWASNTTMQIAEDLSVTTDISVLTALVAGEGPEQYKVICGLCGWGAGQLEGEQSGEAPWTSKHRWLSVPATMDRAMDTDYAQIWHKMISEAVNLEVKEWF